MLRNRLACCACRMTSSRVISPARPVPTMPARSTSRSFASLRMGGFAMMADAAAAGTEAGRGALGEAGDDDGTADTVPVSLLRRRDCDMPLRAVADEGRRRLLLDGDACGGVGRPPTVPTRWRRRRLAADVPTVMIAVPTSTVSPSPTSRADTVPANGDGSSTSDLAVSISTSTWLTSTTSPGFTFHDTISASVRPSPTSGSRNSESAIVHPSPSRPEHGRRPRAHGRRPEGRYASSLAGGNGVSKPETRSTGASSE